MNSKKLKNSGSKKGRRLVHNIHERWCVDVALRICGEVTKHVVFQQYLTVDARISIDIPELWAELAVDLVGRDVYVEHFSGSVSTVNYATALQKIGYALRIHESIPLKNRAGKKAPSMVLLAYCRPDRLLREPNLFRPTANPGIWVHGPLDLGPMFLVAASHLPEDPVYDWLRLATRLPETPQDFQDAVDLMNEQNLDTTKKAQLEDTIMNVFIEGMTPIEVMAKLRAAEEQILIEQEKVRLEQEKVRLEQEKVRLEQEKVRLEQEERRIEQERITELENELKRMQALIAETDSE